MFPLLPGLGRGGVLLTFWKTAREEFGEGSVTLLVAVVHPKATADSVRLHGLWPTRLLGPRNFPDNTGVGLPFPLPGDLPNPGIRPTSPTVQADSSLPSHQGSPWVITLLYLHFSLDPLFSVRKSLR